VNSFSKPRHNPITGNHLPACLCVLGCKASHLCAVVAVVAFFNCMAATGIYCRGEGSSAQDRSRIEMLEVGRRAGKADDGFVICGEAGRSRLFFGFRISDALTVETLMRLILEISRIVLFAGIFLCLPRLSAQGVPTVQLSEFRSQWVGEQVDLIPLDGNVTPLNALGAAVGSLQTPDDLQREVDAALSGVKEISPIAFKPSLGLGWQTSSQGSQSTDSAGVTTFSPASSSFISPSVAFLYDREHGPWAVSAGYSAGFKYFTNPDYNGNGTTDQRNPLSQTALLKAGLEMTRYVLDSQVTASSGTGYDITSGANNQQTLVDANAGIRYLLTSSASLDARAGYAFQNYSQSVATPNNNSSTLYGTLTPVYSLSDKTELSAIIGAGRAAQSLQDATLPPGGVPLATAQTSSRQYFQTIGKMKYQFTGKLVADLGVGATYVTSTGIVDPKDNGFRPAWIFGFSYTPTAKTSVTLSTGQQGADIQPEFNLLLNWEPREKTSVTLGLSQSQQYANTLASQYLVSRGVLGTLSQQFFSSVVLQLSGGYTFQRFVNLSGSTSGGQAGNELPSNYYIANASLVWKIRDWVNLVNEVSVNTGQYQGGGNSGNQAQAWYSISINITL
jgi:hypothetical protein